MTIPQPIFLSGRVMMEDGTPPSEPLVIETVCNGVGHSEGYTDAKGYFAIELGSNRGVIQDASEFSTPSNNNPGLSGMGSSNPARQLDGYGRAQVLGCDLQAKLADTGRRRCRWRGGVRWTIPHRHDSLHRMGKQEEVLTVSAVSLAARRMRRKHTTRAWTR